MQEHPVPQNITSYEFHLIGNMTLKQFLELAGAGLVAFIAYSSNLPEIVKWPIVIFFVLMGIALAFLPIEERPLDTWILAFIRAIYNPTKFHWKKTVHVPDIFGYSKKQATNKQSDVETLTKPQRASRVAAYFQSISGTPAAGTDPGDVLQRALSITQMYDSVPAAKDVVPTKKTQQFDELEKPSMTARPHQLKVPTKGAQLNGTITISSVTGGQAVNVALPTVLASQNLVGAGPVAVANKGRSPLNVARNKIEEEIAINAKPKTQDYRSEQATLQASENTAITEVQKSQALPFPKTPTVPNVVVGMVLDKDGKILESAIVEIRTIQGFPARALKSNRLGQFFASTPLPTGDFEIIIEKDGYTFEPQKLTLTNKVVAPLEIRSQ